MSKRIQTYKDTYFFNGPYNVRVDDTPSVYKEPDINTVIKENPYRANVEIEKDEIVFSPDLTTLHKARGKKHYNGGIETFLEPGSFVFSDDKSMSFSEEELEMFELKAGGKVKQRTPAKVLARNVDPKHYNKVVNNLDDRYKDDISKKSSMMMVEKYLQQIGNVAVLQEYKKDFPDGIPDFAMNSAPIYDDSIKEEAEMQKQYAKYGGSIDNPYLPNYQDGTAYSRGERNMFGYRTSNPPISTNPLIEEYDRLVRKKNPSTGTGLTAQERIRFQQLESQLYGAPTTTPILSPTVTNPLNFYSGNNFSPKIQNNPSPVAQVNSTTQITPAERPGTRVDPNNGQLYANPYTQGNFPSGYGTDEYWDNIFNNNSSWTGQNPNNITDYQNAVATAAPELILDAIKTKQMPLTNKHLDIAKQKYNGDTNKLTDQDLISGFQDSKQGIRAIDVKTLNPKTPADYFKLVDDNRRQVDRPEMNGNIYFKNQSTTDPLEYERINIPWVGDPGLVPTTPGIPDNVQIPSGPATNIAKPPTAKEEPIIPGITGNSQRSKRVEWGFTPYQKLSQLYNWGQVASAQRMMPYRSQYQAAYVNPYLLNPEQNIADLRAGTNQAIASLGTLDPILRNAQAAATQGQFLDQSSQVRSQYDNQNAQILNQNATINNQIRNAETQANLINDANYFQQSQMARANFNNLRTSLTDRAMNNVMRDVETNQALAYQMASMQNPAYGFDFRTGNFTRNPVDILGLQGGASQDNFNEIIAEINKITDPAAKVKALTDLAKVKSFGSFMTQPRMKRGGKSKRFNSKY